MSKAILVTLILSVATAARAADIPPIVGTPTLGTETKELLVRDVTSPITVSLNTSTVRCSEVGYGASNLKVSVPDLKWITVFDHSTPGDLNPLPCITAGMCRFQWDPPGTGLDPSQIIREDQPTEEIQIRVVLKEVYEMDAASQTCHRQLVEDVTTTIRGLDFYHHRQAPLAQIPFAVCQLL